MEVLGAIIATFAVYRAGESARPWTRFPKFGAANAPQPGDTRG